MDIIGHLKTIKILRSRVEKNSICDQPRRKKINIEEKVWRKHKRKKDEDDRLKMKNTRQGCAQKDAIRFLFLIY